MTHVWQKRRSNIHLFPPNQEFKHNDDIKVKNSLTLFPNLSYSLHPVTIYFLKLYSLYQLIEEENDLKEN